MHGQKKAPKFLLLLMMGFTSSALAAESYFCESGDPSGGGPTVSVETAPPSGASASFTVTVDYNRRDLDSSSRSRRLTFSGVPAKTESVKLQCSDCTRYTFKKARTSKSVEFTWCENDGWGSAKLLEFTALNPSYDLDCDQVD